jgi:protoporphyrinogen oxidase
MVPYNYKVWAYHPRKLSFNWIGDRVAVTDLARVQRNIAEKRDDISWGPNNTFRFPLRGGTGEIWRRVYARLNREKFSFNHEIDNVLTDEKTIVFTNGHRETYDALITTIPLTAFLERTDLGLHVNLLYSSVHIFGIGLRGAPPTHLKTKCWMYFPEDNCPFYRVTVFSNYSPHNVPEGPYWSLMAEVSESPDKPVDHATIMDDVVRGLVDTRLITSRDDIVDLWHHRERFGYPTPSLGRDKELEVLAKLETLGIYSRGRFGAWKYEVSNQDHTFMQGVEAVSHLLKGEPEVTVWNPVAVNRR